VGGSRRGWNENGALSEIKGEAASLEGELISPFQLPLLNCRRYQPIVNLEGKIGVIEKRLPL